MRTKYTKGGDMMSTGTRRPKIKKKRSTPRYVRMRKSRAILLVAALVIGALLAGGLIGHMLGRTTPATTLEVVKNQLPAERNPLYGVDISDNQRDNYERIVTDKQVDFVIMRATSTSNKKSMYVDPTCDKAYQLAKSSGKLVGVYFWADPMKYDPSEYAAFCAGAVQGYIGEAMFALDFETAGGKHDENLDPEWAYTWLLEFEEITGVKPLIYVNSRLHYKDWGKIVDNGNLFWLSRYGPDDGGYYELPKGKWPDDQIVLHQYTTSGLGARGTLDKDIFFGGRTYWKSLCAVSAE